MSHGHLFLAVVTAFTLSVLALAAEGDDSQQKADEALLVKLGLKTDAPNLLDFFRKRTLSKDDQAKLAEKIKLLGDDSFEVREQATTSLKSAGRVALPFLRPALKDADAEVRRRAEECISAIDSSSEESTILAAARLLAAKPPDGADEALLNYLPFAGVEAVEEELVDLLRTLSARNEKASAVLLTALKDESATRRAAAALAVASSKDADQRAKVKPLLADKVAKVRFRAAQGLLAAKEKDAIPALIGLLTDAVDNQALEVEGYLKQLAGDQAPKQALGESPEDRKKCRAAWEKWWGDQGDKLDLAKVTIDLAARRVVTTNSGLKYEDMKRGTGAAAKVGDTIEVHYTGWLKDGTKIDSTHDRKTPFQMTLGKAQVIKGWEEGVPGIKVGGKRKLTIPPDLGYGARGAGKIIPPDSELIFEIELLRIIKPQPANEKG